MGKMSNRKYQLEIGLKAFTGLLDEFRKGNITPRRVEQEVLERYLGELSQRWEQRFPNFPEDPFPYSSYMGLFRKGKRDAYLKNIIVQLVTSNQADNKIIVNPACVIARHTRDLASRLPSFRVIGTDIDPRVNRIYEHLPGITNPENFEFIKDNIFDPTVHVTPMAVVFFGACGSVSDGAIDYAIKAKSPYLMFRTCCHHMIGGNIVITHRPRPINWIFRSYGWSMSRMLKKEKYAGFYFSDKYSREHYPRSKAARGVSTSDEFLEVSRNAADTDICGIIIDLDRYLLLVEKGYSVWYKGQLFIAERTNNVA